MTRADAAGEVARPRGAASRIVLTDPIWVPVADAARWAGLAKSTLDRACRTGALDSRVEAGRREVDLEQVLRRHNGRDLQRLRARIDAAAAMPDAPEPVREWSRSWSEVLTPLIDRILEAETRAALAEARLEALLAQQRDPTAL
jgi:hypothetical protein